jgi:pimeloyl-ACP methyl ester carboxylesterase
VATAQLNGITVEFDDTNAGDDALLLVHGHPFNRSMWSPQLAALPNYGWRIIAPDLRGYGESTVVAGTTRLGVFAEDLAALLDHVGVERAVIGGLSMGGQIAMEFCRQYPQRVRGLLLAATFPQPETEAGKATRRAMAERLLNEGMGLYAEEVLPKMLASHSIVTLPAVAAHVREMMRATDPRGAAAALRGRAERPDYEPTLAALDVPTLVVVGSEDSFTTRADAERMHELLTQSELAWLPGIGHMPNLEDADAFNAALEALLDRVTAAAQIR